MKVKFKYPTLCIVASGELPVKRSNLIKEESTLLRGWKLHLQINPFGTISGWGSILHATTGKDNHAYGDRTPGIWFHSKTTKLLICSAVNGNKNYCFTSAPIPLHKHTAVIVQQIQSGGNHQYYYQIFINGKRVLNVMNEQARVFKNVKYYASDPWYTPAKATIRSFNLAMFKHQGNFLSDI